MKPKAEKASEQISVKVTPTELDALQSKLDGLRASFGFNVSVSSYVRKLIQADLGELAVPVEVQAPPEPVAAPPVNRVAKAVAKLKDVSRATQELLEPHSEPAGGWKDYQGPQPQVVEELPTKSPVQEYVEKKAAAETEATVRKLEAVSTELLAKTFPPTESTVKSEDFTVSDLDDIFEGVSP